MISCELIAGTADGIQQISVDASGQPSITASSLPGQAVRGIAVHPEDPDIMYVAAGLRGWGLYMTRDRGETWSSLGFDDYWCWDVAIDSANPTRVLLGTEPPMLWESEDAGMTWRSFPAIDQVDSREHWTFFHAPFHAGHLHGIAITPSRPDRIIVGVEHGGLLLTQDAGRTWRDVMPGADMHRVVIDPADPDRIYAGAGNGLFLSTDGGECWTPVEALRGRYVHGIVIDGANTDRMFVYVDSRHSPIYRTLDGGETWEAVGNGLPPSRPADPIRLHPSEPSTLFFMGDRGDGSTLYLSEDDGDTWHDTGLNLPKVWRLATIERQSGAPLDEGTATVRVYIDREKCIGSANCIASAPTVYRLDENDKAVLIDPETVDEETLLISAESCPTEAIILEDEEGRRIYPS